MAQPFHLAIPVSNLANAEAFYGELLGCEKGRSDTPVSYTHLTLPTTPYV